MCRLSIMMFQITFPIFLFIFIFSILIFFYGFRYIPLLPSRDFRLSFLISISILWTARLYLFHIFYNINKTMFVQQKKKCQRNLMCLFEICWLFNGFFHETVLSWLWISEIWVVATVTGQTEFVFLCQLLNPPPD